VVNLQRIVQGKFVDDFHIVGLFESRQSRRTRSPNLVRTATGSRLGLREDSEACFTITVNDDGD
jgi:hypothetical protein